MNTAATIATILFLLSTTAWCENITEPSPEPEPDTGESGSPMPPKAVFKTTSLMSEKLSTEETKQMIPRPSAETVHSDADHMSSKTPQPEPEPEAEPEAEPEPSITTKAKEEIIKKSETQSQKAAPSTSYKSGALHVCSNLSILLLPFFIGLTIAH